MPEVRAIAIERDMYDLVAAGPAPDRVDIEVDLYPVGEWEYSRSSRSGILGEQDTYLNLGYSCDVKRPASHHDDPFPVSMPRTIANMTVYGREDRTGGMSPQLPLEYMYMDHLYVQEEARGMGYGQLLWDAYASLVAYADLDAHGAVGDGTERNTAQFLEAKGVPPEDITRSDSGAWLGTNRAKWQTDGQNVTRPVPYRVTEVEV